MPVTRHNVRAISASDSVFSTGTVRVTGGPNITVGTDASGLSISGANPGGGGGGSFTLSGSNLSVSDSAVLTGSNAVTVKTSAGQRFVIDAPTQTAQPVGSLIPVGNTTGTTASLPFASNIALSGGNRITLSQSTGANSSVVAISAGDQTVQTQNLHNVTLSGNTSGALAAISSGTLTLAGGNNITVSQAGNAVTISGPNVGGAQTGISGIAASNTTYTSGSVTVTGVGGGITVSSNTGQRIDLSVAAPVAQTVQTQSNIQSIAASNTTYQTGQVEFTGSNAATVKSSANQRVVIDVPVQTAQTQSNVQGVAGSNTTYNTGTVELTGSNIVTVRSSANQRLVIDASQSVQPVGSLVPKGNTVGTTAPVQFSGGIGLAGGANITISQSSGTNSTNITISGGAGGAGGGVAVVPVSNTTGTTASLTSGTFGLGGGNNITISQSSGANSTNLVVVGPATTVQTNPGAPVYVNLDEAALSAISHLSAFSKTPIYFPIDVPGNMTLNTVALRMSAVTTGTLQSFSAHFGLYTFVNSTSVGLVGSASNSFVASTASSASWSGERDWAMNAQSNVAGLSNITPGMYVAGLMFSAAATGSMNLSILGVSNSTPARAQGVVGAGVNQLSTATSQGLQAFYGQGSSTVNALPANVAASEIRNQGTASNPFRPWLLIRS